jgi:hypothetical protein
MREKAPVGRGWTHLHRGDHIPRFSTLAGEDLVNTIDLELLT